MRRQKKMELKTFRILISAILLVPFLAGCGEIRSKLGLNKQAPDEFTVLSQAPLSMPPNFALRAPAPELNELKKFQMNDVKRVILKIILVRIRVLTAVLQDLQEKKICVGYWALIPQTSR